MLASHCPNTTLKTVLTAAASSTIDNTCLGCTNGDGFQRVNIQLHTPNITKNIIFFQFLNLVLQFNMVKSINYSGKELFFVIR
uniref:Uncharacterized protein n=1 Tax=Arundo donax TaxID=35708 RepID=A0A0A9DQW0_ARUDO